MNIDSLPTLNDRAGILPTTVVNPATGIVYAAGAKIPQTAFAAKVLSDLPAPTNGGRSSNYQILQLARDYSDKYDIKIDGNINDRMTSFIRVS